MKKEIIFSYLFSLILIALIFSVIDLNQVLKEISKIGLQNFLFLILLYSLVFVFRGLRWKYVVRPLTKISFKESFFITNTGFFVNALLPARAGEIARAYILSKKKSIGKIKSFSTVMVDRIIDGLTLFGFFAVSLFFIEIPKEFKSIIIVPALLFLLAFFFFFKPDKFRFLGRITAKIFPSLKDKIKYVFYEMKEAGKIFRAEKNFILIIFYSSLVWLTESMVFYFSASAIGIPLSLFQVFLLIVITGFAVMIPSAPSYLGTFEAGFIIFFMAFGLNQNSAVSLAVIIHLIQTIVIIVFGIISVKKLNISFKNISKINFIEIKNKIRGK